MPKRDFQDVLYHFYAVFVVCVTFWIYMKTLAPSVSFFDSGELISAAYTLGVAHPPGYPLYVLLGWCFSKLPIGAGAYRINLMSAFFAALAVLMVYYNVCAILRQARKNQRALAAADDSSPTQPDPERMLAPVLAMAAALAFAFASTHWKQATIAEVYSLNTFLCGAILLLLIKWRAANSPAPTLSHNISSQDSPLNPPASGGKHEDKSLPVSPRLRGEDKGGQKTPGLSGIASPLPSREGKSNSIRQTWLLYLVALLFGLGFGNHQTISLLFFGGAFLVIWTTPRILLRVKTLLRILLFLGLGLSIYLLIPLRAAHNPPINWGNAVTFKQFKWLVLREGYKDVEHGNALPTLWRDFWGAGHAPAAAKPPASGTQPAVAPAPAPNRSTITASSAGPPAQNRPPAQPGGPGRIYRTLGDSLFLKQLLSFNPAAEFSVMGLILALVGFGYGLVFQRPLTIAMLLMLVFFVVVPVIIGDPPAENIFLNEEFQAPSHLLVAIWLGLGATAIARGAFWVAAHNRTVQYALVFVLSLFFLMLPGNLMLANLKLVDRHQNYVEADYATNILDSLRPHAIFFTWGDSGAFPLWYMQIVEHRRPDVTLIHVPHLSTDWYVALLPPELFISPDPFHKYQGDIFPIMDEIVQKYSLSRPIYFDYSSSHSLVLPYELLPHGIVYKVKLPGDALDENVWPRYRLRGILDNARIAMDPDIRRALLMYGSAHIELGNYYLDNNQLEKAANEFNAAVKFDPSLGDRIVQMLQFRDKMGGGVHTRPKGMANITVIRQPPAP